MNEQYEYYVRALEQAQEREKVNQRKRAIKAFEAALTVKERLQTVYIPLVLTQVVFRYLEVIGSFCAQNRLPFKKELREIRMLVKDYYFNNFSDLSSSNIKSLENQVNGFFDEAGRDVQTLYFVINSELKKVHPELEEYELLTYIYMTISLLDFTHGYIRRADRTIYEKTDYILVSEGLQAETKKIHSILLKMAQGYSIKSTQMIELAIKIIGQKVDNAIMEIID